MSIFVLTVLLADFLAVDEVASQGAGVGTGRVGSAIDIRGSVESNVQGRAYPLNKGGVVYNEQWVNTREKSVAGLGFYDETKMHIGPNSSVKLNKTIKPGIVSVRVKVGSEYRFKTSPGDKTTYHIIDPNGATKIKPSQVIQ
jgi:hypothetical protein